MSKSNTFENDNLLLVFNNTSVSDIGDASGLQPSATEGSLYISLHKADVGEAGDQTTNEADYGSYDRQAVARNASNWSVSSNQVSNVNSIEFPEATSGTNGITHFAIGTDSSGPGKVLYYGSLSSEKTITTGDAPFFDADSITVTED